MTQARNERPLHTHTRAEEAAHPWTQDTLTAHLQYLHGVVDAGTSDPLPELLARHDALNHGGPRKTDEDIYQSVLHPERRLDSASLEPCLNHPVKDYPDHRSLVLGMHRMETRFCMEPPDVALVRAAVSRPADASLEELRAEAVSALGPGARRRVDAAHALGYSLGVDDMLHAYDSLTEAERVADWLEGFYESAVGGDEQSAVSLVREMISRRLAERESSRA